MKTITLRFVLVLSGVVCLLLSGCDMDPFKLDQRKLVGNYYLEYFPDGNNYYILDRSKNDKLVVEGVVRSIAIKGEIIYVKLDMQVGHAVDQLYVIDGHTKTIRGPFVGAEAENLMAENGILLQEPTHR